MMKIIRSILLLTFLLLVQIIPTKAFAATGQYFIDNLDIDAQILPNGDVEVNETIKYRFEGDFNGIYRDLNLNGTESYIINGVSVIDENGKIIEAKEGYDGKNYTYEVNNLGGFTQIKLYSKSNNENKSFNLNYTIKNAAKKYIDYGRLNWNFYTVENVESIKEGTLKISLKDQKFEENSYNFTVFGDGDINYENNLDNITINFKNLTSLIGIDLQFNKEYLPTAEEVVIDPNNVDNSVNDNSYIDTEYNSSGDNSGAAVLVLMIFIGIGVIIIFFIRGHLKFQQEVEKYRQEIVFLADEFIIEPPSDLPPAIVNLLVKERYITDNMLNATLFYLVSKGYYSIEERDLKVKELFKDSLKSDLIFTRLNTKASIDYRHINYLLEWFKEYEVNESFSLEEIKNLMNKKNIAKEFIDNFKEWQKVVTKDAEEKGIYIKIQDKNVIENSWYVERNRWLNYKKYLKGINVNSNIDENKISDLTVIYAQALGIEDNGLKNIIDVISNKAKKNAGTNMYPHKHHNYLHSMYLYNYIYYSTILNTIHKDADNTVNPPSTFNNTGGISGGGGFSGGGGGGSGAF